MRLLSSLFISLLFFSLYLLPFEVCGKEEELQKGKVSPPPVGNFILPGSQQLGPFVSFGQNIIDQGQTQLFFFADDYGGANLGIGGLQPYGIYGITDNSSVYLSIPTTLNSRKNNRRASGMGDVTLQFEGVASDLQTSHFQQQLTLVGNVIFPTSSGINNPPITEGNYRFLLGTTFSRLYVDWYMFTSEGFILSASHHGTKPGDQFLYQAGLGRCLFTLGKEWLFAFLLEMDGQYSGMNRENGQRDLNSGSNIILLTPSLWVSSEHLTLQLGMGMIPLEHLKGEQEKKGYLLVANIGWTF